MTETDLKKLQQLIQNWDSLSLLDRQAILVLGRVLKVPAEPRRVHRTPRGETPEWLAVALNILKDSNGYLPDREIAKKLGISCSTLCRNESYRNAKRVFAQELRKITRVGRMVGKLRVPKN